MKKILYIFIILIFVLSSADAANYYVDANCGDGETDYDKTETGVARCSGGSDTVYSDLPALISGVDLEPGDFVYLRAATYSGAISIGPNDSGSSGGGYVTIKTYEDENVTLEHDSGSNTAVFYIWDSSGSTITQYIKIDGRGADDGKHLTIDAESSSQRNMILRYTDNIYLTGINLRNPGGTGAYGIYLLSIAYGCDSGPAYEDDDKGPKNTTMEYLDITGNYEEAIKITGWGTDDNIVRYCDIYEIGNDAGNDIAVNVSGSGYAYGSHADCDDSETQDNPPTGNKIYENTFRNLYGNGFNSPWSVNSEVYNNTIYENGDGDNDSDYENSSARGLTASRSTGLKFYNNYIYDVAQHGIIVDGCTDPLIYNNVVVSWGKAAQGYGVNIADTSNVASGAKIYNNSIISTSSEETGIFIHSNANTTIIKNNIVWVETSNTFCIRTAITDVTIENNDLYDDGAGYAFYDSTVRTVGWLNESWGGDAEDNIDQDPQWDENYELTENTLSGVGNVRDNGQTLSGDFTTDKAGVTRPQGDDWDIGAYEYEPPDSRNVTISIDTDVDATCKFDLDDVAYASMDTTFESTGGQEHTHVLDLFCDASYTYYTRCTDGEYTNDVSTEINFSILASDVAAYSRSSGGASGSGGS